MSVLRNGAKKKGRSGRILAVGGYDKAAMAALERDDHVPVAVRTVEDALDELTDGPFDCLLLDGSGPLAIESIERLRDARATLPIVAFCGDETCIRDAIDAGATDVVRAPPEAVSVEELVHEVATVLDRHGYQEANRHEAIADLGQRALEGTALSTLMERAVSLIAEALGVDYCEVFELQREKGQLVLRENIGLGPEGDDVTTIDLDRSSIIGHTLSTEAPVVVENLEELHSSGSELGTATEIGSGISVVVGPSADPWGVLGVHATDQRSFSESDVSFVRSVANVLGGAIAHDRAEHGRESELDEVYSRVTDAFLALDSDARVIHLNDRAEKLLGLPREELLGQVIWEQFPEVFEETFREDYWEAMERQEPIERERYYPFLDRWYEGRAYPSESGLSVYFRDITDRKRTEQELRDERNLKKRIVETSPIGITVTDAEGQLTFANERAEEIFGRSEELILTHTHDDDRWNVVDEDGESVPDDELPFERVKRTEEPVYDQQLGLERPDGQRVWISTSCAPLFDGDEFDGSVHAFKDDTESRRLEEELGELLGRVNDGFFGLDTDWRFTFLNERAEELINPEGEDLVGKNIWEQFPDAVGIRFEEEYRRAMETQEPVSFEEYFEPLETWFSVRAYPSETGLSVYFQDVTEQRKLEAEFEEVLGRVTDAFYSLDPDWNFDYINGRAEELINPEDEDLVGKNIWEQFPEAAESTIGAEYHRAMETQEPVSFEEYFEPLETWFSIHAYPSETGLSVYFKDITERKEHERETEKYETLTQTASDVILTIDTESVVRDVNPAIEEVFGYTPDDLIGESLTTLMPEELTEGHREGMKAYLRSGERQLDWDYIELPGVTADGGEIPLGISFSEYEHDGERFFTGIIRDITERKEMEKSLREREAKFRTLAENLQEVVWMSTLDTDEMLYINPIYEEVWGRSCESLYEEPLSFLEAIHPEDRERVRAAYAELPDEEYDEVFRVVQPDGEIRWIHAHGIPIETDGVARIVGIAEDITERKERESRLERYKQYTDDILDAVDDVFYVLDSRGDLQRWNESLSEVTGYTHTEIESMHALEFFAADDRATVTDAIQTGLEDGHARVEAPFLTKGGESVPHEFDAAMLENPEGEPVIVGIGRDITERKRLERQLRNNVETLQEFYRIVSAADTEFDGKLSRLLDLGCERLDLSYGFLTRIEDGVQTIAASKADHELLQPGESCSLPETYCRKTIESDRLVDVHDTETAGWQDEPAYDLFGYGSYIGGKVLVDDTLYGTLCFASNDAPREPFTDAERTFVELACEWVGQELERTQNRREIDRRMRQQNAIATLGQCALTADDLDAFFREACELVTDVLDTEYCDVLDLDAGEELLLREGVGWSDEVIGRATVTADGSQPGYTLTTGEPVIVDDLAAETRFSKPELLAENGVISGISVIIGAADQPWGILGTHDTERREFDEDDTNFLQSVANVLANAIERTEHEQRLEYQREQLASINELNAAIREISHGVLETSSREEIETAVCERLADRYRFAWIGGIQRGENVVTPRVAAGVESGYLDEIEIAIDADDPTGSGPTGTAMRTREPQFWTNILEDPDYEPWREQARERNYQSSAAIPIQYDDALYGVLNVYSARPNSFEGGERQILSHLGEIIGHAIYALEQRKALVSDSVLELELQITDPDNPLIAASSCGETEITFERTIPTSDGSVLQFVMVSGMSAAEFEEIISQFDPVEGMTLLTESDEKSSFELTMSDPPLVDTLAGFGGRITSARISKGELRVIAELPPDADTRAVLEAARSVYPSMDLLAQRTEIRDAGTRQEIQAVLTDRLTEKQRTALETAYFAGYFDWPRNHTGEEVAELLDLSSATFTQHLRIAERKLFGALLTTD